MKKIALFVAAFAFMAGMSFAQDAKSETPKADSIKGWITDAKCAKMGKSGAEHAGCAEKCIKGGQAAVLVTDSDKKVLNIENADAVKGHEGHHVNVMGHVNGDSVHVDSVSMLEEPKAAKQKDVHKHGM